MTDLFKKSQKIGRNDPCHCGSGKKYKKCCLEEDGKNKSKDVIDEYYQRIKKEENLSDSQIATRKAIDYVLEKYENAVNNAIRHFIGHFCFEDIKKAFQEKDDDEESIISQLFNEYALIDYEDEDIGTTLLSRFYEEQGDILNEREQESIYIKLNTIKTLYEIQKVMTGKLLLKDYFSGEKFWVNENKGSFEMKKWDIIFARVEKYHDGTQLITGSVIGFPRGADMMLNDLKSQYKEDKRLFINNDDMRLFNFRHSMTPMIFQDIADYYLNFKNAFVNKEGHKLIFCEKTADIVDYNKLVSYFENNQFLTLTYEDEREKVYCWLDKHDSIKTSFYLKNKKITVEVNSKERMKIIENKFLIHLKEWTTNWRDEFKNPDDLMANKNIIDDEELTVETKFVGDSDGKISKKDEEKLLAKLIKKYYDSWVDTKIPALNGMTPRQAAADPKNKERLVELLKTMENRHLRSKKVTFDIEKIKKKLGIKF